ncbi:LysR family transcriptional regulator [Pseudooceanicola nanhaiensis]|uniref:LysR family transcriptional regulator n=1 Tax=Pseudooceanicola nanhaiensis TaxID=375761 RepID=UPI001CD384D3|nr:LysR family transcriptional regulator [Pseudooceanicola nanhaiensis]MCA0922173.1 LysR family transcriptional regulator [Pseudooceanicola nanhaiensis]
MDAFRTMRLFVAIAEGASLSSVARDWGVAPSTVSYGLQALEERLGAQLVIRTTRQHSLTEEGERFLQESRRILSDVDEVMTGIANDSVLSGNLRITSTNDFGRQHVAPLVDAFVRDHPGVTVDLFLADGIVDLVEGGFDLAVRTGPLRDSDLKARLLLRGQKNICAAPAYWARHGKPQHPAELAQHNCLLLGEPGERQSAWTFRKDGERLRVRVSGDRQVNDGEALRQWAIAGAGIVQKSSFDIAEDLREGRLETALHAFTAEQTNLYAVSPPRQYESRRVRAFVDFMVERLSAWDA